MKRKNAIVIGAGINGLVAAYYLAREGCNVHLIEKKAHSGGACTSDTWRQGDYSFAYPPGASVFGLMQDFIFEETGLKNRLKFSAPGQGPLIYFPQHSGPCIEYGETETYAKEAREKWGEEGDVIGYFSDLEKVIGFLRASFREGQAPSLESASAYLGSALTDRFIRGSAWDLVHHYFSSEQARMYHCMPVTESGPVSLRSPFSAFTIALMNSGSVLDGSWGYIHGGIWSVTRALTEINRERGIWLHTEADVRDLDADAGVIVFECNGTVEKLQADAIFLATDPVTAARLSGQERLLEDRMVLGSSGKLVLFFSEPIRWSDSGLPPETRDSMRFIFDMQTLEEMERRAQSVRNPASGFISSSYQIYSDGLLPHCTNRHEYLAVFFKDIPYSKEPLDKATIQKTVEEKILGFIGNRNAYLGGTLSTPGELAQKFYFPGGNLDHVEVCQGQTFFTRTYSSDPQQAFYRFGNFEKLYYCGAGAYPCGSVTGTAGYLAVQNWKRDSTSL